MIGDELRAVSFECFGTDVIGSLVELNTVLDSNVRGQGLLASIKHQMYKRSLLIKQIKHIMAIANRQ